LPIGFLNVEMLAQLVHSLVEIPERSTGLRDLLVN